MNIRFFNIALFTWIVLAVLTFIVLLFVRAPYGRHIRKGFGPLMSNPIGWLIMESPASILMIMYYLISPHSFRMSSAVFLIIWELHYVHRAFIYPFRMRNSKGQIPVLIVIMAIVFNLINTGFNGVGVFVLGPPPDIMWFSNARFVAGTVLFLSGFGINLYSDNVLRKLRKTADTKYKIPYGGFYRWVSCPNYLGEIMEWTGWALLTWSLAGLSFCIWTASNLIPRAIHNHKWYNENFPDYPKNRKAVIPFIL
ncbi:MAG: DUF1295 domain-containing protein [Bacteroidales bacterium]|nr:DUF1295 domain-containing protein [Bacteroidales bacterium]